MAKQRRQVRVKTETATETQFRAIQEQQCGLSTDERIEKLTEQIGILQGLLRKGNLARARLQLELENTYHRKVS